MKIDKLEATFENGDMLVLQLLKTKFDGVKETSFYKIEYAELVKGQTNAWEEVKDADDKKIYFSHQPEYFPVVAYNLALSAFHTRYSCSNPKNESDRGWSFEQLKERSV